MRKSDIASYLVSLNALMEAQSKGVHAVVSPILAAEYTLHWEMLKSKIKEDFNETRNGSESNGTDKDRAPIASNFAGGGKSARHNAKPGDD